MKLITTISSIGLLFTIGLVLAGCPSEQAGTAPAEAVAELHPTEGNMVQGLSLIHI